MSVAEPFGLGEARQFELHGLAAAARASFTPGALLGVDVTRKLARVHRDDRLRHAADRLRAEPQAAVAGAITFRGPADTDHVHEVLRRLEAGEIHRLAFVVPAGAVWTSRSTSSR